MIVFDCVRYKNLLSSGNVFTEIFLNQHKQTLIIGTNGAGKSSVLDALSFVLYNKPFRNINKPQLINTINQKGLLVEVEFTTGTDKYIIRRGMKPNIFEIIKNEVLLNQDASARDYQEYLERNILKLNHKSFCQIVILGSASFVPFMQLSSANRRSIIEDILDIQIFSTMNVLLKSHTTDNKNKLFNVDHHITIMREKIRLQEQHVKQLKQDKEELISTTRDNIELCRKLIEEHNQSINQYRAAVTSLRLTIDDEAKITKRISTLATLERQLQEKMQRVKNELEFFHDTETCPTCRQEIDQEFKCEVISDKSKSLEEVDTGIESLTKEYEKASRRQFEISGTLQQISKIEQSISNSNSEINLQNTLISRYQQEIEKYSTQKVELNTTNTQLQDLDAELRNNQKLKDELVKEQSVYDVVSNLLKDSGIKSKIIKQYIPIMNKLINKYLASMDFFVNFELNENFEEKIKSRYRDEFSYASFSEGEKTRLNLAILFAWRAIAKLRNSAATNILFFDEVLDGSLDLAGIDDFLKIIYGITGDTNIFIISHKDAMADKFINVIRFEKVKNFSRIAA
jgi:DNA repair exonuclease SbcCD ATPase subunit